MRVLITRPEHEGRRTAAQLAALGHEPVLAPLTQIIAIPANPPADPFDGVIVTSAQAIRPPCLPKLDRQVLKLPLYVVGRRTAEEAQKAGFERLEAVAANAAELSDRIGHIQPGARLLYLAGRDRKPDLERALAGAGIQVAVVETYEARALDSLPHNAHDALWDGRIEAVLHFSRRSAELFVDLARKAGVAAAASRARHCAISVDAAAPLAGFANRIAIAKTPDARALFETLI